MASNRQREIVELTADNHALSARVRFETGDRVTLFVPDDGWQDATIEAVTDGNHAARLDNGGGTVELMPNPFNVSPLLLPLLASAAAATPRAQARQAATALLLLETRDQHIAQPARRDGDVKVGTRDEVGIRERDNGVAVPRVGQGELYDSLTRRLAHIGSVKYHHIALV